MRSWTPKARLHCGTSFWKLLHPKGSTVSSKRSWNWGAFIIQITTLSYLAACFLKDVPTISNKIVWLPMSKGAGTWTTERRGVFCCFSYCRDGSAWPWACVLVIAKRAGSLMAVYAPGLLRIGRKDKAQPQRQEVPLSLLLCNCSPQTLPRVLPC